MKKADLSKHELYEAVKTIVEHDDQPHIHLCQHKLFTLFSIAFQYMLFRSTKMPGAYIVRIEDSILAEKLAKRSKDPSTRKFLQTLLLPRKLKYKNSFFYLDFFYIGSWTITNNIPKDKVQGAVVIKNTSSRPMDNLLMDDLLNEVVMVNDREYENSGPTSRILSEVPEHHYLTSLQQFVPKTITIAYETQLTDVYQLSFPFIKKKKCKALAGVTIANDIDLDNIDD